MLLRRVVVAGLRLLLLLRILVAGLLLILRLLRRVALAWHGILLLRVAGSALLTRIGIEAVTAALTVGGSWRIVVRGALPVKQATHHFAHFLAKLGQKLNGIFIMCRRWLLGVTVALLRLLVAGRGRILRLLRITTLLLRIVALLRLHRSHGGQDDSGTPAPSK